MEMTSILKEWAGNLVDKALADEGGIGCIVQVIERTKVHSFQLDPSNTTRRQRIIELVRTLRRSEQLDGVVVVVGVLEPESNRKLVLAALYGEEGKLVGRWTVNEAGGRPRRDRQWRDYPTACFLDAVFTGPSGRA